MEPISLAVVTSAVVNLAIESAKQIAPEIAKDTWSRIKALLGWTTDVPHSQLPGAIAARLQNDEVLAEQIADLLKQSNVGISSTLVGSFKAKNVAMAQKIETVNFH